MRLPVVPQISTKDGTSNRNARLTNCLNESKKSGDKAVVRPGLVLDAVASGVGHGLVVFNNELVSVYGATLGKVVLTDTVSYWTEVDPYSGTSGVIKGLSADGSKWVGSQTVGGVSTSFLFDGSSYVNLSALFADQFTVTDISGDGLTIVGYTLNGSIYAAKRWTAAGGVEDLGTLGGTTSIARSVSYDGSVVVGQSKNAATRLRAFRWTSSGGMVDLGAFPGQNTSDAYGVSGDGLVVVGYGLTASYYNAFKWTSGGGMVNLGTLSGNYSDAWAASYDGSVIAGTGTLSGNLITRAWSITGGGAMTDLGTLGGADSQAFTVSDDGLLIGGRADDISETMHSCTWGVSGITNLATPGETSSTLSGLSANSTSTISGDTFSAGGSSTTGADTIAVVSDGSQLITTTTTIVTIGTIVGDRYDFAQSPL